MIFGFSGGIFFSSLRAADLNLARDLSPGIFPDAPISPGILGNPGRGRPGFYTKVSATAVLLLGACMKLMKQEQENAVQGKEQSRAAAQNASKKVLWHRAT